MNLSFLKSRWSTRTSSSNYASLIGDVCLIVHDNVLLHVEQQDLVAQHDESILTLSPSELAEAARRLLPNTDKDVRITLALPNSDFVATQLQLPPSIDAQNLRSAVSLQLPTLLPGIMEPLLLAVRPQTQADAPTVALWLAAKRAEELFHAFAKEGLFLTTVIPRVLVAHRNTNGLCQIFDEDENTMTYVEWQQGTLQRWLHFPKIDFDMPEFKQQVSDLMPKQDAQVELTQIWKTKAIEWEGLAMPELEVYGYAFTPPSALIRMNQEKVRAQRQRLSIVLSTIVVIIAVMLAVAWYYQDALQKQVNDLKAKTKEISALQAEVVAIEEENAPIANFPNQKIIKVLQALNDLIPKNSWISSIKIEKGVVEIIGYSPDPPKLVENLSQEKFFTEVTFSQQIQIEGTRPESRFGISFKLQGIDVTSYWTTYFPTVQQ